MSKQRDEKEICRDMARQYAKKDWHRLSFFQRDLVADLGRLGYLTTNNPPNGFVGTVTISDSEA